MFDWLLLEAEIFLGLICVAGGLVLGLGVKNFAIPRIKQHIFNMANDYIAGFMQNLQNNPEVASQFVAPFIEAAMKQLQSPGSSPGKPKSFKIAGIPIPGELISMFAERILGNIIPAKKGGPQNLLSGLALPEG